MRYINAVALLLMIAGAINWALVGIFEYDVIAEVFGLAFGEVNAATRTVYIIVGAGGLWGIYLLLEQVLTLQAPVDTTRRFAPR